MSNHTIEPLSERFSEHARASAVALPEGAAAVEGGSATSARGFSACGVHAGFKKNPDALDAALVAADEPCVAAGVFTTNVFCAAPVIASRAHLERSGGVARAVIVNSGNANAATGSIGLERAEAVANLVADELGCTPDEVLVASTGVIGVHLPLEPFEENIARMAGALSPAGGADAARAIMTTDTHPKHYAVAYESADPAYADVTFTVGGMAKGAGMIMPNMATMIAVITTDAPLSASAAHAALVQAANMSFNRVTVDSDTSTNDTCLLLANGAAAPGAPRIEEGSAAFEEFSRALAHVCTTLARAMAADGEGATRLVTVNVTGAATDADAEACARTIANSPLVKTAIFGHDANWGRIAAAAGRSGAAFAQEGVAIDIMGIPVCRDGLTVPFDEEEALRRFEAPEITLDIDLGAGTSSATMWTCDLTHDYVTINGDYRT